MRAFVVGATGYTGEHVVVELRGRKIETLAHVRPTSPELTSARTRFLSLGAAVEICAWEESVVAEALARFQPTHVFSLLGTTRRRASAERISGNIYEAVEGQLTRLLVNATRQSAPEARFIFLSSMGTSPGARSRYLRTRAGIERHCTDSGLRSTIARAPIISGKDRSEARPAERMAAVVLNALLAGTAALGGRRVRDAYHSMTGRQLARALVNAALDANAANRILEPSELRVYAERALAGSPPPKLAST